ncbi:MAG: methionine--tRNA ligase subunit beta [Patescibacteria group bacterium]
MNELKPQINLEDFAKLDIRAGTVLSAEEIEGSEKLLKLSVDFGDLGKKQILSGIKLWYKPEDLKGNQYIFILNIEPRKMMGLESQGMILAVDSDEKPVLLTSLEKVKDGSIVR